MFHTPDQQPPSARVVRGAGGPLATFVARAKPKLAVARSVIGVLLRVVIGTACVIGVGAILSRTSSRPKYDFKMPKFDFKMPPAFDADAFRRSLDLSIQLQRDLDARRFASPIVPRFEMPDARSYRASVIPQVAPAEVAPTPPTHGPHKR